MDGRVRGRLRGLRDAAIGGGDESAERQRDARRIDRVALAALLQNSMSTPADGRNGKPSSSRSLTTRFAKLIPKSPRETLRRLKTLSVSTNSVSRLRRYVNVRSAAEIEPRVGGQPLGVLLGRHVILVVRPLAKYPWIGKFEP